MVAACREMKSLFPSIFTVICGCHRLQTVIRHTLELDSVRKLLGACRKLVGHFKHSNVASHALRERQKQEGKMRTLCLVSEVPTRWNSTFDMLARLLALRVPITAVLNDGRITKVADQMLNLTAQQWKQVEDVCNLLEPFKGVTNSFSSSSDVTISTVLPLLFGLLDHCAEDDNESLFLSLLKRLLKQELTKKFHLDDVKLDSCEVLASALDPRFKKLLFLPEPRRSSVYEEVEHLFTDDADRSRGGDNEPPSKRPCVDEQKEPSQIKKQTSLLSRLAGQHGSSGEAKSAFCGHHSPKEQLQLYLDTEGCGIDSDPLLWWKQHESAFPEVAKLARRILAIPASSAESERSFSVTGILTERRRASLGSDLVDAMMFLNQNSPVLHDLKSVGEVHGTPLAAECAFVSGTSVPLPMPPMLGDARSNADTDIDIATCIVVEADSNADSSTDTGTDIECTQ